MRSKIFPTGVWELCVLQSLLFFYATLLTSNNHLMTKSYKIKKVCRFILIILKLYEHMNHCRKIFVLVPNFISYVNASSSESIPKQLFSMRRNCKILKLFGRFHWINALQRWNVTNFIYMLLQLQQWSSYWVNESDFHFQCKFLEEPRPGDATRHGWRKNSLLYTTHISMILSTFTLFHS